ncbi:MFS transporter [Burkholderia ubonensis]|uniref:MFS transporter n=1 Tax=Burkholderia ubonensis TaxID=101571 RepID=UPI0009B3296F|nr:MFS transporter [Burkholderia ubonensis]
MLEFIHRYFPGAEWTVAALFGSMVAVPFHDELKTKRGFAVFVFTGVVCGYFLTVPTIRYFHINQDSAGGVGFLLGAFGGSLISAVLRAIKEADLWALVKSRFGGGGQ